MTIPNKETYNALSQRGLLGNYLRTFGTLPEAYKSKAPCFTIRSTSKQSPYFVPVVERNKLLTTVHELYKAGAYAHDIYFQGIPAPDTNRVIQFEAMLGPQWDGAGAGVELFYELDTTQPVRGIRERCKTASGLKAQVILRTLLEPRSYDTLMDIWDRYPTAIIEASEFSRPVGALHERLCIWETRDY